MLLCGGGRGDEALSPGKPNDALVMSESRGRHLNTSNAVCLQVSGLLFFVVKIPRIIRSIVAWQVALELSELAHGMETIQLANIGHDNPVRRILDVMLHPSDPRWRGLLRHSVCCRTPLSVVFVPRCCVTNLAARLVVMLTLLWYLIRSTDSSMK